jgi:Flp pilus assembly protein TadG
MALALKAPATFTADESGTISPMFGLVFAVMILCVGAAIDTGRAIHSKSTLGAAADAASLAGGKALLDGRLTDADVRALALRYFQENVTDAEKYGRISQPIITIDRKLGLVKVDAVGIVETTAARISGVQNINLPVTSTVQSDQKDIELGLALDVTGSMSGQKILDLKSAAKDLVDILIPNTGGGNKVRIGLAPYSASVNAGQYAALATNGQSTSCVHERGGSEAFSDAEPTGIDALGYTLNMFCPPTAEVLAMTNDKTALKANINSYTAGGRTAGHIGAAWASYLISPEWKNIWPNASRPVNYGDKTTVKAMVDDRWRVQLAVHQRQWRLGCASSQSLRGSKKAEGDGLHHRVPVSGPSGSVAQVLRKLN